VTDAQIAHEIAAGRHEALGVLYDRYAAACYSLARRIVVDEQLAQDVVQEAFLAVWRGAERYDGARGPIGSWLLTLTHHKAVDLVRREQRHQRQRAGVQELDTTPADEDAVEDVAAASVRAGIVRHALRRLPQAQREPLLLAYFGGYTQAEIARMTGNPLGTVKTRMFAGVRRLRELLDTALAEEEV
jgi:RNA polymerase sigma-70 factor (ECF subfamily)